MTGAAGERDLLCRRVERALGAAVRHAHPRSSAWGLQLWCVELADGHRLAAKYGTSAVPGQLLIEADMLRTLAEASPLPVPAVRHAAADLLLMDWIDNDGAPSSAAHQRHAAELLARLHNAPQPHFGWRRDTVIGGLAQPNPRGDDWLAFFRDQRLLHMVRLARAHDRLPPALATRLERFAERLDRFLTAPAHPSLLHGDLWGGNILVKKTRVAAFIDPAVYCGHPEIELAFSTLFGTFGRPFFDAYRALAPLEPGFSDCRRDIYNLYPLLVHATLFGASYLAPIDRTLARLGS